MDDKKAATSEAKLLEQKIQRLEKANAEMSRIAGEATRENRYLREELHMLYMSGSWKITAPLRKAADLFRKLKG
jgi:hypothetical protein